MALQPRSRRVRSVSVFFAPRPPAPAPPPAAATRRLRADQYVESIARASVGRESRVLLPPALRGGGTAASPPTTVSLAAGRRIEVEVQVAATDMAGGQDCFVAWEFATQTRSVAFSLLGPGGEVLMPLRRLPVHSFTAKGCALATAAGVYRLVWSNEHSSWRGKTLTYRAYLAHAAPAPATSQGDGDGDGDVLPPPPPSGQSPDVA